MVESIRDCNAWVSGVCVVNGEQEQTHLTCKYLCDPHCPSKSGAKVRQVEFPDVPENVDKAYEAIWFTRPFSWRGELAYRFDPSTTGASVDRA